MTGEYYVGASLSPAEAADDDTVAQLIESMRAQWGSAPYVVERIDVPVDEHNSLARIDRVDFYMHAAP